VESTNFLCWINLDSMWNKVYVKLSQFICGINSASPRICSRELLCGINQASFTEKAYVDSTLLVLCGISSMWIQRSVSSGFVRVDFYTESIQLLSMKRSYVESTQLLLPPKKLLGSGFSTLYAPFCLICTISSELKCISHLFLFEWAGFVPIWVSQGFLICTDSSEPGYPLVFSGRFDTR